MVIVAILFFSNEPPNYFTVSLLADYSLQTSRNNDKRYRHFYTSKELVWFLATVPMQSQSLIPQGLTQYISHILFPIPQSKNVIEIYLE